MEHDAHYALFITKEYSTLEAQICFTSQVGNSNSMSVTSQLHYLVMYIILTVDQKYELNIHTGNIY